MIDYQQPRVIFWLNTSEMLAEKHRWTFLLHSSYLSFRMHNQTSLHRRTGNFLPGGAVNYLRKKFSQVAQIFTKQYKRNEGHTMQQRRPYWHMKVARYCNSFSGSIPPNFEHNYVAIDKGFNDIGVVIATKWRHCLFYLQQYFLALGTVPTKSFTATFSPIVASMFVKLKRNL